MQTMQKEVRSKSDIVGTAEYSQYDSIEEAVEHIGASAILTLVNAQVKTNAMNNVRSLATGKPSKKRVRAIAMSELTTEEFSEVAGDLSALEALLERKSQDVEQRLMAEMRAQAVGVEAPELAEDDED